MVICSFKCINPSLKANKGKHPFLPTATETREVLWPRREPDTVINVMRS